MLKLSRIRDRMFINIDNFFQGTARMNVADKNEYLYTTNVLNVNYMEWELNQDIFDIALFDIKSSFSWIIPGFIIKFAGRVKQLVFLFLYTDVAEEEISRGWAEVLENAPDFKKHDESKVIFYPQVIKEMTGSKYLSIIDWLKMKYIKSRVFITIKLLRKPYYLLGNFTPNKNKVPEPENATLIREFAWAKLNPAFAFYKRI
jgi:hypothetical protein